MLRFKVILFSLLLVSFMGCEKKSQTAKEPQQTAPSAEVIETFADQAAEIKGKPAFNSFSVYKNKGSPDNHFIPSGWMGDFNDVNFNDANTENPHSGSTCIKVVYSPRVSSGARWAGVYWQNPANNWGSKKGGFDLTGATMLKFWARGENGGERVEEFKIGGLSGEYPDSDTAAIGPVILTKEWREYTIDLRGKDLSYISGGFCWATNLDVNPDGATFYLDDIVYE